MPTGLPGLFASTGRLARIRHAPLITGTITLTAFALPLTRLASFRRLFAPHAGLTAFAPLGSRLPRILFSTTLARLLARFPSLSGLARLTTLVSCRGLRDFALQLLGQRIEFRLRQSKLFRVVAQYTLGRAFDATTKFLDAAARLLASLPRLRQIALAQHVAGEVEGFAAGVALGSFLQAIVEVTRQHAAREQITACILKRVRIVLADLPDAVVKLP